MGFFDAILFPFIWFNSAILVGVEWLLTRMGLSDTSGWTWVMAIIGLVLILRAMSRRFREGGERARDDDAPYGPRPKPAEVVDMREQEPVS